MGATPPESLGWAFERALGFQFLASLGVGDHEFLLMEGRIGAKDQASDVAALDVDEVLLVIGSQAVEQVGVDGDANLVNDFLVLAHDGVEGALEFHAHRHGAFDHSFAAAMRARDEEGAGEALIGALAGHFHEPELRDWQHMGAGLVAFEAVLDELINSLLVATVFHVDEVRDDEPPDVAQAELAGDLLSGFKVRLEDGFFHIPRPLVAAGVDVHRDHGLGLVDDDVATAGQPDLAVEGGVNLGFHTEAFEDRLNAGVMLDGFFSPLRDRAHEFLHSLGRLGIIDDDGIDLIGEEVTDGAFDEIGFLEEASWCWLFLEALLDLGPLLEKEAEIAHEIAGTLPRPDGAHDHAHALWHFKFAEDFAEAVSFLRVLDLAGDAELVVERHENEVSPRHADVCGDAGALVADRALLDLDEDIGADRVDIWHVLVGDARGLLFGGAAVASHGLDAAVEGGGNGIPELEEGIFFESDVHEHRLDARFDVAHLALEDAADDIAVGFALDGVFLEAIVLEERNTLFEFFTTDHQLDAGGFFSDS